MARISRDGESAVTGFQLLRRLAGRLTLLTLLAVVVGWGLWGGTATPQAPRAPALEPHPHGHASVCRSFPPKPATRSWDRR